MHCLHLLGSVLSLLALLLLAGGCLLDFFIVLSGGVYGNPVNKVYFLEAATGGIGSSPTPGAAWTWNSLCRFDSLSPGSSTGTYSNCRGTSAAPPFDPTRNFGVNTIGTGTYFDEYVHDKMFINRDMLTLQQPQWILLRRFKGFMGSIPCCSLLRCRRSLLRSPRSMQPHYCFPRLVHELLGCSCSGRSCCRHDVSLRFHSLIDIKMTNSICSAWTVIARNHFRNAGIASNVGRYAYGFTWATFVCWFLAMILFCCGGVLGKKKKNQDDMPREEKQRSGFFARNRTNDPAMAPTTGVKDDYS